ncbi:AtpZ/AtpI family protein [Asticcacaulis sp. EMRT-3]|uniref:AtpZ/AtpI family protein n=1 Tax=Asticcacaulis sp. EMRT-3 TaxID=3040349 RepID=UPI0024AF5963|nr:AtpZ/AtpI family protein [Asticcacaulis sp. EMRT-3]MDI7774055.1 AtpZ/AtpI family protein [Asticcacaulis sp. EMRT-3]
MTDELPDESSAKNKLSDLDKRLTAIETRERKEKPDSGAEVGASKGYQALGQLLGGIVGGLGLGWVSDHYLHTLPWGMIIGAIFGMVLSVYLIAKTSQS